MRLLFVSHSFPPPGRPLANLGGMQRVAVELHEALAAHPAVELRSELLRTSWRWTHWRTGPFLARAAWRLWQAARRRAVDAVLFSSMVTATLAWTLRRVFRENGVATGAIAHGRDVTLAVAPYQWMLPRVFASLDRVFPVSRATGEAARTRGAERVTVVPNGVDTARFSAPADPPAARRELLDTFDAERSEPATLLCSVGRHVERKGFDWFAEHVLPRLPEGVCYWIAGAGPRTEALRCAARRAGVAGRVRFLGRVSEENLHRLYRGADLFVMPNVPAPEGDMEGFGVVMLEAGLSGLPTVAARLEGIRDVIAEGENGHLVPPRDAEAFAAAVRCYHDGARDPQAAGQRAAAYVERTFGWEAVAGRYVEALARVA
ncbi:MAG: glycosyltransferase family 4 protein [Bacteroidetes bacterium QS_9_68_14]|nr:MAG: glycosyltransferase family 4 protein [Bacteroidetes bacterium QS_9_68_14]